MSTFWRRTLFIVVIIFVAVISALSGALAGGLAVYSAVRQNNATQVNETFTQPLSAPIDSNKITTISTNIETDITQAVESIAPAVVTVVGKVQVQSLFFGAPEQQEVSGSGVIIEQFESNRIPRIAAVIPKT